MLFHTTFMFIYSSSICVGRHLADASVWIAAASILAAFDIVKAKDEGGREITPLAEMVEGIIRYSTLCCASYGTDQLFAHVSHPAHFECAFRPRREQMQKLMEE